MWKTPVLIDKRCIHLSFNDWMSVLNPLHILAILNTTILLAGDITQKGYEKKRAKLIRAYLPHAPGTAQEY